MKKILNLSVATAATLALLTGCSTSNDVAPAKEAKPAKPKPIMVSDIEAKINAQVSMFAAKVDVKNICSVEKNGIKKVTKMARLFNDTAVAEGVEFRRLGINNSSAIAAVQEGIKSGAKTVTPADVKGKKKQKFDINYAAERACKFAIGALRQKHEAEQGAYRDAIPGDGFKY